MGIDSKSAVGKLDIGCSTMLMLTEKTKPNCSLYKVTILHTFDMQSYIYFPTKKTQTKITTKTQNKPKCQPPT